MSQRGGQGLSHTTWGEAFTEGQPITKEGMSRRGANHVTMEGRTQSGIKHVYIIGWSSMSHQGVKHCTPP